ncbi:MAG: hypothetical protein A2Y82_01035 [Candidatus Buchananbacteria bacterium RBG_13_36_9]|uniref:Uncharacterized protein n=1 Tax=Candidatus Buchananbacteria bacterium RBG_13_36_9 TaxID=1797530 RepID=A0A1G1XNE6_9BACT|nr:MAG: hypothetical protein A2Y82_01035 [Candidatus Buchananbacteria bacterium RBG_13_36_9]
MKKTILVIVISILVIIALAIIFSIFFVPIQKIRYSQCVLLQNIKTGRVDCYGCANDICKDAETDWVLYQKTDIGILYACFSDEKGCHLAQ